MIESISIASVATYGENPEIMDGLSQFNYVFGSNSTGKTTVSRIIADKSQFPTCAVNWKGGTKLQTLVYNRDFVERNFDQSSELKGVFTLGEKSVGALKKIAEAKSEHDELTKKIENFTLSLEGEDGKGGEKGELASLEEELQMKCWEQKQKHDEKLKGAFEGFRNSAVRFKDKVLQEYRANSSSLLTLAELEKKAESVFGAAPTTETTINTLNANILLVHEKNAILEKRVIGKEDVDIALMIKKLDNSDWVRQGRAFYDVNDRICPFCQQITTEAFEQSLKEYFDETFDIDSKAIDDLVTNYNTDADRLQKDITSIIATPSKFLETEKLKAEKELLDSRVTINQQRLAVKKKEPSRVIELESISNVFVTIKGHVDAVNIQIAEHNQMVENLSQERRDLTAQIWKYLIEKELKTALDTYKAKKINLEKAITSMTEKIEELNENKKNKVAELRELERQTTSVQPTIEEINVLLYSFGFQGFSLAKAGDDTSYKLIRADGSDAKETLSEGERAFLTFLYFYHLLKGSQSESGMTNDRVVVFDDPVSSLDSDVLFVVSSLIKGLFEEVRSGRGHIKQVFVFTHNVYFHKEVAFNPNRRDVAMNEETFWIVRKDGLESRIERHNTNPIKTSYELLWAEVRKPDRSTLTIQNILRRILENYYKILGGVDPDKICEKFDGKEKLICRSLFSWVHAGSHFAHDDLYVSTDGTSVDAYLKVFKAVFEKTDQLGHYKMMMGD